MKLLDKPWYAIVFMFAATLAFSAVIIFFGTFTRQRVMDNERLAIERAVLEVLPETVFKALAPDAIHKKYLEVIKDPSPGSGGAYRYFEGESLIAYALPVEGAGFWALIKGMVGIAADERTVTGIAFYEQNETPGLGGEIVKPYFKEQFAGKILSDSAPFIEIRLVGAPLDVHSVHAVTGATQTSQRMGNFLNARLEQWRAAMQRLRKE